jgi:hypothetical protein
MKSARMYDFTIPANGSFQLNVEGEYVRIMSSTGTVELVTDTYRIGPIAAGQGQANTPFKRLTINDKSGATNVGTLLISSSDFVDQRISGEVSVIDGGKSRSLTGGAITGHMYLNAVAGLFSTCQIWNPAGSGKNIIIGQMIGSIPGGFSLQIKGANTPLPIPIIQSNGSKKIGGAVGVAIVQAQNLAVSVVNPAIFAIANGIVVRLTEPFILSPGTGLNFGSPVVNNDAGVDLEYFEENI